MSATAGEIQIRPVRRDEADAWRALRLRMLKEHPEAFSSAYEDALERSAADWTASIAEDGVNVLFGLYADGELSGSAGFFVEQGSKNRHKGTLVALYVAPELAGRGYATALARRVIEHARKHVQVLLSGVIVGNAASRSLQVKLGFEPYGVEREAIRVDGRSLDEELLSLRLRP